MGKKYIIELPENTHWIQWIMEGTKDHHPYMDFKQVEDLTPYTKPDLEQFGKEAYDKGYHDGHNVCCENAKDLMEEKKNEAYQHGLADAWKAARKIHRMPDGDILDLFPNCYASVCTAAQAILKYDASEAIEKIRQCEQEQEEIKVGDEVGYYGVADEDGNVNYSGVVLEIRKDDYLVMEKDGRTYQLQKKLVMSKTGRHFPEIATVLEKMRGEKE